MRLFAIFPSRRSARVERSGHRGRSGSSRERRTRSRGGWERLGACLLGREELEGRVALTANLGITLTDNAAWASPAAPIVYTLTVANTGDAPATNAAVTSSFASALGRINWTVAYSGGGSGPEVGAGQIGDKNPAQITLPAGAQARRRCWPP